MERFRFGIKNEQETEDGTRIMRHGPAPCQAYIVRSVNMNSTRSNN